MAVLAKWAVAATAIAAPFLHATFAEAGDLTICNSGDIRANIVTHSANPVFDGGTVSGWHWAEPGGCHTVALHPSRVLSVAFAAKGRDGDIVPLVFDVRTRIDSSKVLRSICAAASPPPEYTGTRHRVETACRGAEIRVPVSFGAVGGRGDLRVNILASREAVDRAGQYGGENNQAPSHVLEYLSVLVDERADIIRRLAEIRADLAARGHSLESTCKTISCEFRQPEAVRSARSEYISKDKRLEEVEKIILETARKNNIN